MKTLGTLVFVAVVALSSMEQAQASLKILNCGTPRHANGKPGDTTYSVAVVSSTKHNPDFYLLSQNIYRSAPSLTEPLTVLGNDEGGWWTMAGSRFEIIVRNDYIEAGIKSFSGEIMSLWCR